MQRVTPYLPGLSPVSGKEIHACFDGGRLSSNCGVLVLREIEDRLGIADRLASNLTDSCAPANIQHSFADMIRARMFAISQGHEDCNDLDILRFDPAFKLACCAFRFKAATVSYLKRPLITIQIGQFDLV